jgi:hypothetical protein
VLARYAHNIRLIDALNRQAFAALRQPGNRLVGILHGCVKTGRTCDETTHRHTINKIDKSLVDTTSSWDVLTLSENGRRRDERGTSHPGRPGAIDRGCQSMVILPPSTRPARA